MRELRIPASIEDVDTDWLSAVLHDDVTGFESTQIGEGIGIMGQLFRVTPTYRPGAGGSGPASVIVKLPSPFEANRQQGIALGLYEAEVRFYNELKARTATATPYVHYATIVPGTADFVIVSEDLSHLAMVDQIPGLNELQARAAVRALADLHASWWGKVGTADYEWLPTVNAPRIEPVAAIYPQLWAGYLANFGDDLPDGARAAGDLIAPRWGEIMNRLGGRPQTLIHMDYRSENMFFSAGLDVTVIDWQTLGRGPGAYDLAYLLGGNLEIELRRELENDLVGSYHARLVDQGVTGYPLETLWSDYRLSAMAVTATPIFTGATLDLANERGRTMISGMGSRLFSSVVDNRSVELL
jgi:Phosphotransferase enzyme family